MPCYDALLFDFDGVLADTEPVHFACWGEILRPFGIELDWQSYRQHAVGVADLALLDFFAAHANPPVEPARLREKYPEKRRLFMQRVLRDPPITPAVVDMIKSLSHLCMAVVTSSNRIEIEPVLERAGIRRYFGALVCGGDVQRRKPAPDAYLLAAQRLGAKTPLVVEDSEAGLASGRAAGFDVLHIPEPSQTASLVRAALGANFR